MFPVITVAQLTQCLRLDVYRINARSDRIFGPGPIQRTEPQPLPNGLWNTVANNSWVVRNRKLQEILDSKPGHPRQNSMHKPLICIR